MSEVKSKFDLKNEFQELLTMGEGEKEKILDYCDEIDTLVSKNIGISFKNTGNLHAAVVMSNIFLNSEKSIKIFAGCFNGEVSGVSIWKKSLEFSFENSLDLKVDVILEESPKDDSIGFKTIKQLQNLHPERVTVSLLNSNSGIFKSKRSFHFTVGDDRMYRFETDTKQFQAVCNFDDPETSKKLINYFDIMQVNVSSI